MEVEDEDALLQRLFFKRFGRALPDEKEKEKEKDDVDKINFVIDLTDDTEEMQDDTTPPLVPIPVVKTEPIEIANVNNVANVANVNNMYDVYNQSGVRASRRLELIKLAKARKDITEFGKSLRKKNVIPEKEAPEDTDMAEDRSVNPESGNNINTIEMAERALAESEAAIAANQKVIDEFDD
jgi:hypothetical protein